MSCLPKTINLLLRSFYHSLVFGFLWLFFNFLFGIPAMVFSVTIIGVCKTLDELREYFALEDNSLDMLATIKSKTGFRCWGL